MTPSQTLGSSTMTWQRAALRIGEELAKDGPLGYYDMGPDEWLSWALAALAAQEASPPQSVEGLRLPVVEGHVMMESLEGFQHRCLVQIARLQGAAYPDHDSIAVIAQAVRCAREYQTSRDLAARKVAAASPQPAIARQWFANYLAACRQA
jgi:hypothetical protein